ncbi:hypothetical protein SAMN05444271_11832 [Halohasta litchfieldiae]|jgi:hypothetical protein|uniref:Uncharacterized protein n=1 Tax=Halohasta litchfieldiae TaxID=1073996 RepID=A0A1H6VYX1_9EURY|nr:hypothetical protein SAMN05444271_11832 [Halohasta litchfieldiae]
MGVYAGRGRAFQSQEDRTNGVRIYPELLGNRRCLPRTVVLLVEVSEPVVEAGYFERSRHTTLGNSSTPSISRGQHSPNTCGPHSGSRSTPKFTNGDISHLRIGIDAVRSLARITAPLVRDMALAGE